MGRFFRRTRQTAVRKSNETQTVATAKDGHGGIGPKSLLRCILGGLGGGLYRNQQPGLDKDNEDQQELMNGESTFNATEEIESEVTSSVANSSACNINEHDCERGGKSLSKTLLNNHSLHHSKQEPAESNNSVKGDSDSKNLAKSGSLPKKLLFDSIKVGSREECTSSSREKKGAHSGASLEERNDNEPLATSGTTVNDGFRSRYHDEDDKKRDDLDPSPGIIGTGTLEAVRSMSTASFSDIVFPAETKKKKAPLPKGTVLPKPMLQRKSTEDETAKREQLREETSLLSEGSEFYDDEDEDNDDDHGVEEISVCLVPDVVVHQDEENSLPFQDVIIPSPPISPAITAKSNKADPSGDEHTLGTKSTKLSSKTSLDTEDNSAESNRFEGLCSSFTLTNGFQSIVSILQIT